MFRSLFRDIVGSWFGNNKCKNNRPLFSDEETINIMGSSIGNINIQFYYFIHTIG